MSVRFTSCLMADVCAKMAQGSADGIASRDQLIEQKCFLAYRPGFACFC